MSLRGYWLRTILVMCFSSYFAASAGGQSIAPGQLAAAAKHSQPNAQGATATSAGCSQLAVVNWYFPLWHKGEDVVECFYNESKAVAPLNEVKFLYGFGGGDSKTLSSDLASIQFPGGLQANLGQSVTMGTSTSTAVTTTTTPTGGSPTQTTSMLTTDTPATTISKIEQGGDLFVRFEYPLLYDNKQNWGGMVFAVPRFAGDFSGFGSEATITQANDYNFNVSIEAYGEWRAFQDGGLMYADLRTGVQYIQPEVAQKLGLGSQNKFGLTQFAAGIEFAKLVRFGFQRFIGPSGAFGVAQSELSKWHLVLSLVPKKND